MDEKSGIESMIMLIVGIAIAVLIIIFMGVFSGVVYQETEGDLALIGSTETAVNESFLVSNETAVALSHPYWTEDPVIYNRSTVIGAGNFTFNLLAAIF